MKKLVYFFLGIYVILINWHYNHNVICAFLAWLFWPIYLVYELVTGHLAHHAWYDIPASYFN